MTDIRLQLPECPLEYEVPLIPGTHTALVISMTVADINWQEKMLPWTLASLINNTDIVISGVHIYIVLAPGIEGFRDRIQKVLSLFNLPEGTITEDCTKPGAYDTVYTFDINHWAFRDGKNQIKLPIGDIFKRPLKIEPVPSEPFDLKKAPSLYNMKHATAENFRNAIKHLMAAQLAMKI